MFVRLHTLKAELLILNLSKVLFFGQSKGKNCVVLEDGNVFEIQESMPDIEALLRPLLRETDR